MLIKIKKPFLKLFICIVIGLFFNTESTSNTKLANSINAVIQQNQEVQGNITSTNSDNRYAFILFYLHRCPHCQRFDPIVRRFSKAHSIPVLPYTLDGESLPSFPGSISPSHAEILKFFPTQNPVVPTLFLMDQKTHRIYPVLQGEATEGELSQRLSQLISQINEIKT